MTVHQTIDTPDGPFTVVEQNGVVVASAWSSDTATVAARAGLDSSAGLNGLVPGECASATAVAAYYQGDLGAIDQVRIGPAGTEFRTRVWNALREIPAGQTRTYGEVAARLGNPAASRAVGAACGANALALFIPCHRVAGAHGKLTGFAWGVDIKRALLEREAAALRH